MSYAVYIFHPDGRVEQSTQPKAPTGDQVCAAVGGPMETIPYFTVYCNHKRGVAYANENGIMLRLTPNRKASELWWQNLELRLRTHGGYDKNILHGPVIYYAKMPKEVGDA
jgi:hypothetical protein